MTTACLVCGFDARYMIDIMQAPEWEQTANLRACTPGCLLELVRRWAAEEQRTENPQ